MEIDTHELRRNLRAYYVSRVDILALVIVGVIILWLESGMELAQILLLQGIFVVLIMILEFPSGVLADITSRRNVLVFGYLAEALGIFIYIIGNSFNHYLAAEVAFAFALSFKSGSDTAMIYDSFDLVGRADDGDEVIARGQTYHFAAIVVLQAMGGLIASISIQVALWLGFIGALFQAALYVHSVEPLRVNMQSGKETTLLAVSKLRNVELVRVLMVSLVVSIFLHVAFWDYIPRFKQIGLDVWIFGIMLSGANLVAFVSSVVVKRRDELQSHINVYALIAFIGLALWQVANSLLLVVIAIALHQITRGSYRVAYVVNVNNHAEGSMRASLHSLISGIGSGLYFIFTMVVQILEMDTPQILRMNIFLSFVLLLVVSILGLIPERAEIDSKELSLLEESPVISQP